MLLRLHEVRSVRSLSLRFALLAISAFVLLATVSARAAQAYTCTDKVSWDGIGGHLISDTCQTQVNESGFCPLDNIQSNTVKYTGNDFGFGGTSWRDLTLACAPDWVPMTRLFFEERGAWVAISTSLYGSGTGTFTRTWVGR